MVVVSVSAGATRGIEENGIAYRGHHTADETRCAGDEETLLFTAPRLGRIRRVEISTEEANFAVIAAE